MAWNDRGQRAPLPRRYPALAHEAYMFYGGGLATLGAAVGVWLGLGPVGLVIGGLALVVIAYALALTQPHV